MITCYTLLGVLSPLEKQFNLLSHINFCKCMLLIGKAKCCIYITELKSTQNCHVVFPYCCEVLICKRSKHPHKRHYVSENCGIHEKKKEKKQFLNNTKRENIIVSDFV